MPSKVNSKPSLFFQDTEPCNRWWQQLVPGMVAPLLPELANEQPLWPTDLHTLSEPLSCALTPSPPCAGGGIPQVPAGPLRSPRSPGTASCRSRHFLHWPHHSSQPGFFMSVELTPVPPGQWRRSSVAGTACRANDFYLNQIHFREKKKQQTWFYPLPKAWPFPAPGEAHAILFPCKSKPVACLCLSFLLPPTRKGF